MPHVCSCEVAPRACWPAAAGFFRGIAGQCGLLLWEQASEETAQATSAAAARGGGGEGQQA